MRSATLAIFLVLASLAVGSEAHASAISRGPNPVDPNESVPGQCLFQLTSEAVSQPQFQPELAPMGRTGLASLDASLEASGIERLAPVFDMSINPDPKRAAGMDRVYVAYYDAARSPSEVVASIRRLPEVAYAEPNGVVRAAFTPNDTYYLDQWAHNNTGQAIDFGGNPVGTEDCDTDTDLAWDLGTGNSTFTLAILDSGCDLAHVEYSSRIVAGYDFINDDAIPEDDNGHGTACAGIALAAGNNGIGVAGVAWNVQLMPVKVLDQDAIGAWFIVANGITFAADNGARILSLSLGGSIPSETLGLAVDYAFGLGCALFCASGNDNLPNLHYPARYVNAIAVGAMSPCCERKTPASCDGEFWWGSNYGANLDFVAPGTRIHTTDRSGADGYEPGDYVPDFNGTSSATPQAAGIGALVWSRFPELTNVELRALLQATCDDIGLPGYDPETGFGRVNAYEAMLGFNVDNWVGFDNTGTEDGTYDFPFNTLGEGLAATSDGGIVGILPGTSPEVLTIDQQVILRAVGGTVVIGQ